MPGRIRLATVVDAAAVLAIYEPYVLETAISFETESPSVEEMRERISHYGETHPWLVYELDGRIAGYAYSSPWHARAAYAWSCEVSIYVDRAMHRRGIGRALYIVLLEALRRLGYYTAIAGVTEPNPASVGLHESMGFHRTATYRNVGFKAGRWWDVTYLELALQDSYVEPVALPIRLDSLTAAERKALLAG
jgi:L-amino acid N-acyltransferase YncA